MFLLTTLDRLVMNTYMIVVLPFCCTWTQLYGTYNNVVQKLKVCRHLTQSILLFHTHTAYLNLMHSITSSHIWRDCLWCNLHNLDIGNNNKPYKYRIQIFYLILMVRNYICFRRPLQHRVHDETIYEDVRVFWRVWRWLFDLYQVSINWIYNSENVCVVLS